MIKPPSKTGAICSKNGAILLEKNKYLCNYCSKNYTTKYNLNRHLLKCKDTQEVITMKDELMDLLILQKEQTNNILEEQEKKIVDLQNKLKSSITKYEKNNINYNNYNSYNNFNNTINNTITILSYNNTKTDHLTNKDWATIMKKCFMSVSTLVKKLHYDPKIPENFNIYKSNIKNKYVLKYTGNDWDVEPEDDALETLYYKNTERIEDKKYEWENLNLNKYDNEVVKFTRFLDKYEDDDVKKNIKEILKVLLYNNRLKSK